MPPKLHVKNYSELLSKLCFFLFATSTICFYLLRFHAEPIRNLFRTLAASFPQNLTFAGLAPSDAAPMVLAMILAWLSHSIRWHDRLSDLFGIRHRFDIHQILIPSALLVGANLDQSKYERLLGSRNSLMRTVFYKYSSSGEGDDRVVSNHTLREALTSWSWYWVLLEALSIMIPTSLALAFFSAPNWAFTLSIISILFVGIMQFLYGETSRYARAEIIDIISDPIRANEIRDTFENL